MFIVIRQVNVYELALELEEASKTLYYVFYLQYSVRVMNAYLKLATLA